MGRPDANGSDSDGSTDGMSPTTAIPHPWKSNAADSTTESTTTTTGPGTGRRSVLTQLQHREHGSRQKERRPVHRRNLARQFEDRRNQPVRLDLECRSSCRSGLRGSRGKCPRRSRPGSAATGKWQARRAPAPARRDTSRPPREPASTRRRHGRPEQARGSASTAAMTVMVAASGPTMSCREGPKIA